MRIYFLLFSVLSLVCCGPPQMKHEKLTWQENYEKITRIHLPKDIKIISHTADESLDPVRKTVVQLNKKDCKIFSTEYGFAPINDSLSPQLLGSRFMDSVYQLIPDKNTFLHKYGKKYTTGGYFKYDYITEQNSNWVYLLDTINYRLYCLISSPDINGYVK